MEQSTFQGCTNQSLSGLERNKKTVLSEKRAVLITLEERLSKLAQDIKGLLKIVHTSKEPKMTRSEPEETQVMTVVNDPVAQVIDLGCLQECNFSGGDLVRESDRDINIGSNTQTSDFLGEGDASLQVVKGISFTVVEEVTSGTEEKASSGDEGVINLSQDHEVFCDGARAEAIITQEQVNGFDEQQTILCSEQEVTCTEVKNKNWYDVQDVNVENVQGIDAGSQREVYHYLDNEQEVDVTIKQNIEHVEQWNKKGCEQYFSSEEEDAHLGTERQIKDRFRRLHREIRASQQRENVLQCMFEHQKRELRSTRRRLKELEKKYESHTKEQPSGNTLHGVTELCKQVNSMLYLLNQHTCSSCESIHNTLAERRFTVDLDEASCSNENSDSGDRSKNHSKKPIKAKGIRRFWKQKPEVWSMDLTS